jgi:hypothetical protein
MMGIETIFENYKATSGQETAMSEEQEMSFNQFSGILESLCMGASKEEYQMQQQIFDSGVSYARASEKSGFIEGFKTAMRIMLECQN